MLPPTPSVLDKAVNSKANCNELAFRDSWLIDTFSMLEELKQWWVSLSVLNIFHESLGLLEYYYNCHVIHLSHKTKSLSVVQDFALGHPLFRNVLPVWERWPKSELYFLWKSGPCLLSEVLSPGIKRRISFYLFWAMHLCSSYWNSTAYKSV